MYKRQVVDRAPRLELEVLQPVAELQRVLVPLRFRRDVVFGVLVVDAVSYTHLDKWFEYDYIGGLTHGALAEGTFFPWYKWVGKRDPLVVQNGGFSLRSKRLLEAPSRYGIVRHIKGDFALNNEDIQLCCYMRPALESVGMVFAPDEEAKRFALPDYLDPTIHGNLVLEKVYGHHSALRRLASENTVLWGIPDREVYGYDKILRLFEGYGYAISRTSLEELVKSR